MEISETILKQVEAILKAQSDKQMPIERLIKQELSPDLVEMVIKSGRLAPCTFILSPVLEPSCSKGYKLDCLNCPDYEPVETPGQMGEGIAQFENGQVIHLGKSIESDGYYRSGITICARKIDEVSMAVELYPDRDISNIPREAICKKCAANVYAARFNKTP
jgi:hypothetical protein